MGTLRFWTVWRTTTHDAIMDQIRGAFDTQMPIPRRAEICTGMDWLASVYSKDNLATLAKLRSMGPTPLEQAGAAFGYKDDPTAEHSHMKTAGGQLLDFLMNAGLFNAVSIRYPEGKPVISVPYTSIEVFLDIDDEFPPRRPFITQREDSDSVLKWVMENYEAAAILLKREQTSAAITTGPGGI